jgi:hypothetical protein
LLEFASCGEGGFSSGGKRFESFVSSGITLYYSGLEAVKTALKSCCPRE